MRIPSRAPLPARPPSSRLSGAAFQLWVSSTVGIPTVPRAVAVHRGLVRWIRVDSREPKAFDLGIHLPHWARAFHRYGGRCRVGVREGGMDEVDAPLVFHCNACRSIVADSWSFVVANEAEQWLCTSSALRAERRHFPIAVRIVAFSTPRDGATASAQIHRRGERSSASPLPRLSVPLRASPRLSAPLRAHHRSSPNHDHLLQRRAVCGFRSS